MKAPHKLFAVGALLLLLLSAGCAARGPSPLEFTVRQFSEMDRQTAMERAEIALITMGYEIDRRDEEAGVITTKPVRGPAGGEPRAPRISISDRSPTRHICEVRVTRGDAGTNVHCRVVVQQLATEAHRMFLQDRGISDSPAVTPIEREAATTEAQNQVWQAIRRDKIKERELLSAIAPPDTSPDDTEPAPSS
jgi:hypothetical protein